MNKEDLFSLVFIGSAALYVAAHVVWAVMHPSLPALVNTFGR